MIGMIGVPGCSDRQEQAKTNLEATSYAFTVDDFMEAASLGRLETVKQFLDAGMAVDVEDGDGNTALLQAARGGQAAVVGYLLSRGAAVDFVGAGWDTPLIAAARSGDVASVKLLLDAKARTDQKNEENWSALTVAAFEGHSEVTDILAPGSRNMLDDALQLASLQGHLEVMDRLLSNGASVYARSREGELTPLMFAAANGHADAVRLLLENGANRFALDDEDRTAAEQARDAGYSDVAALLSEPPSLEELRPSTIEELAPQIIARYERAAASLQAVGGVYSLPEAPYFLEAPAAEQPGAVGVSGVPGEAGLRNAGLSMVAAPGNASAVSAAGENRAVEVDEGSLAEVIRGGVQGNSTAAYTPRHARRVSTRRLSGATVPTLPGADALARLGDGGVRKLLQMHEYRESQLPVMLTAVPDKSHAEVRVLYGDASHSRVVPGDRIPGTHLEVLRIEPKLVSSKLGNGHLVDMSRIVVEDQLSGERHLVVKDVPARSSEPFAVMSFGDAYSLYDARNGDEFSSADGEGAFRVNDVRLTSVVIENLRTGETFTISKAASRDF